MKQLKFDHSLAKSIIDGTKRTTWRFFDDKNIVSGDEVQIIDKVDSNDPYSWRIIGQARIVSVTEKALKDLDDHDRDGHESYENEDMMMRELNRHYKNTILPESVVKIIHFEFRRFEEPIEYIQKSKESVQSHASEEIDVAKVSKVKVFTDGGSRGNPGPSASGFVIYDEQDTLIERGGRYLGITTNNQAEYRAVKYALEACHKRGVRTIDFYLDSLLVVNQMKGIFKIKNRDLWPVYEDIKASVKQFESVEFTHVPREFNKAADAVVNELLDEHARG